MTRARAQADAALRALRHPAACGSRVATLEDVALTAMLLELADATESSVSPTPPVRCTGSPSTTGSTAY
ncbi:hypothetical protein ACFQV4_23425 [Streptomyces thermocarboxydus]